MEILISELRKKLKQEISGQDHALEAVIRICAVATTGICDSSRPLGSFLFLGPTGTGKSETPRALAKIIHGDPNEVIAINCTEFKNPHDVAKLTGAPPGYIGHERPPFLTPEKIQKNFTIIIFEELEKADHDFFNILLQVLERGELTTGQGVRLNFTKCLIFMTSNIGARELDHLMRGEIGFSGHGSIISNLSDDEASKAISHECLKALERNFNPEFINRIDEIIVFNRLKASDLGFILDKFLSDFTYRVNIAGVRVIIDESVKKFLIEKGFNQRYGARPLKRAIRTYLEFPLVEKFLLVKETNPDLIKSCPLIVSTCETGLRFEFKNGSLFSKGAV